MCLINKKMFFSKNANIFCILFVLCGIISSIFFSKYLSKIQIDKLNDLYVSDARAVSIAMGDILDRTVLPTTLARVMEFEYPTYDKFVSISDIDSHLPGVNHVAVLEYLPTSQHKKVEDDFISIYNMSISVRSIPPTTFGFYSWIIYYMNPFDLDFIGLEINSIPSVSLKLEETRIEKKMTVMTDITMIDNGELAIATFQPILGKYSSISILTSVRRYTDLFREIVGVFLDEYHDSIIRVVIKNKTVFDSSAIVLTYDPQNDNYDMIEDDDIVFESMSVKIIISSTKAEPHLFISISIIVAFMMAVLLLSVLLLTINHSRIKKTTQLTFNNRFISTMSHEAKTLMNGILGMCDLLLHDGRETEDRKLKIIRSCGRTLMRLVDDVIDLSHINNNTLEIHKEYVDIKDMMIDVIDSTWDSYMADIDQAGKEICLDVLIEENTPSKIISDGKRIAQVLTNIISNSLKYTQSGNIKVELKNELDTPERYLHILVSDTGIGMDSSKVSSLFQEFSIEAVKNDDKSMGLGMKLTKKICDNLGCIISCESVIGTGTSFNLRFLMDMIDGCIFTTERYTKTYESMSNDENSRNSENSDKPEDIDHPILIVDDVKLNRTIMSKHVRNLGFKIETSVNGKCALEMCQNKKYSMIMMDISMPIMDGVESLKNIRASSMNKETPAIFVTADVVHRKSQASKLFPQTDLMTKPINADGIKKTIEKHVLKIESPDESNFKRDSILTRTGGSIKKMEEGFKHRDSMETI